MSDCPDSPTGHEIEWKDQYRRIGPEEVAESGVCVHCDEEARRVFTASRVEERPLDAPATHHADE